jgi:hypothetical protein
VGCMTCGLRCRVQVCDFRLLQACSYRVQGTAIGRRVNSYRFGEEELGSGCIAWTRDSSRVSMVVVKGPGLNKCGGFLQFKV